MRRILLFALIVLVAGAGIGAWLVSARLSEPFKAYDTPDHFLDLPTGTPTAAIGRRLVDAGIVRDRLTFRLAMRLHAQGRTLKAGEYRFDRAMTPREVIDTLANGDVYLRAITFPEGLTIQEMATLFEKQGFGKAVDFAAAAAKPELIAGLDPKAPDLEGYLFPDTYLVPRSTSAADLVRIMVARFEQAFDDSLRRETQASGRTIREVVALAALVEKETARPEERPVVAGVYANRLRIGMALQGDPTVIYALTRAGRYSGNLTRDDLQFDSPYNTYRYPGLPPGPIAAPGKSSLEAAVRPAKVDYLYFVSRNDGSHVFANTLDEHNRNVHEFQVEYFRQRRLEQK